MSGNGEEEELEARGSSQIAEGPDNLVTARDFLVDDGEHVDMRYRPGNLTLASGASLTVIPVAVVDNRLVVAVPESAWHRTPGRRLLPGKSFSKPSLCAVVGCIADSRDEESDISLPLKVWFGFLAKKFESQLDFVEEVSQHNFGMAGEQQVLPFAPGLTEAVREHYAYLTAGSEAIGKPATTTQRIDQLEQMLSQMQQSLDQVLRKEGTTMVEKSEAAPAGVPGGQSRPSALKRPPARNTARKASGLDPGTVQAALSAGIPMAHIEEIGGLMKSKPRTMEEAPRKKKAPVGQPRKR